MDPERNQSRRKIEKPRTGDLPQYEQLYDRYYSRFCQLVRRQLTNRQLAEDLVTDSFVRLWEKYSRFHTEEDALRFLGSGLKQACLETRGNDLSQDPEKQDQLPDQSEVDPWFSRRMEWNKLAEVIQHISPDRLSANHRKAFYLYYKYGFSIKQVAEQMKVSASNIQGKLTWSIYILKKYFLKPKAPV